MKKFLVLIFLGILGCDDETRISQITKIDMTTVESLYLYTSENGQSINTLYQIDGEGNTFPVRFMDALDMEVKVTTENVEYVENINDQYFAVGFKDSSGNNRIDAYLIDKKIGKAISLKKAGLPQYNITKKYNFILKAETLYYLTESAHSSLDYNLTKVDIASGSAGTTKKVDLGDLEIERMHGINEDGNLLCEALAAKQAQINFLYKTNGEIEELESKHSFIAQEKFFYSAGGGESRSTYKALSLDENNNAQYSDYTLIGLDSDGSDSWEAKVSTNEYDNIVFEYSGETYFLATGRNSYSTATEIYLLDGEKEEISVASGILKAEFDSVYKVAQNEEFLYVDGVKGNDPRFIKINVNDWSKQNSYDAMKDYSIQSMVAREEFISFTGKINATEENVLGKLDLATGEIEILKRDTDSNITIGSLVKIK